MTAKSILVRKEKETGKVITTQLLFDNEDTEHVILTDLPEMEEREGFNGQYVVSDDGSVTVEYTPIPKTEVELLEERLNEQEEIIADLMLQIATGGN